MALPWHIPLESAPESKPRPSSPKATFLKHLSNLNVHETPQEELQTGLMCEIGINNKDPVTIQRLIAAGMTVARLDMRDLDPEMCSQLIQSIRQAVYKYSVELDYVYPLALMVDIRGPDIITGDLKGGPQTTIEIIQSDTIRLTNDNSWRECGTSECLYVNYDHLTDLHSDDIIYIDSLTLGKIKLIITDVGDDSVECVVNVGGIIGSKMPVRVSRVPKELNFKQGDGDSLHSLSSTSSDIPFEHTEDQVAWAVGSDVDAVLVPNAQYVHDIKQVRDMLDDKGKHILVIASIETTIGLDNIDQIIANADGIYIDRTVLSTDLSVEKIFMAQKSVVAKCNEIGKPCICKAVINEQIPTLCVTDIANLVLDGVDVIALELHYDSPLAKISACADSVKMAENCLAASAVICRNAEHIIWKPHTYGNIELMKSSLQEPSKALCVTAAELAMRSHAAVIICLTNSGRTAKLLSRARPSCPVVAVTRTCHTARQLRFWRSIRAMHYFEVPKNNWLEEVDSRIRSALDYCKIKRILKAGDPYVVLSGTRRGGGYCDSIRLLFASIRETIVVE